MMCVIGVNGPDKQTTHQFVTRFKPNQGNQIWIRYVPYQLELDHLDESD